MRYRSPLIVGLLLCGSRAFAFADSSQFFANPAVPHIATLSSSSEGIYFTGAPRFAGQTCAACHINAPNLAGVKVGADLTALFSSGYVPGQTYALEVELVGETRGLQYNTPTCTDPPTPLDKFTYVQCNNNNYALEIDTATGPLQNGFCASAPVNGKCPTPTGEEESQVAPTADAVFGNVIYSTNPNLSYLHVLNDAHSWHLWWTAPPAGTGPLTLRVAIVDGNGGSGTAANNQDPYNDDVVTAAIPIEESGYVAIGAQAGCATSGRGTNRDAWGLLLLAVLWSGKMIGQRRHRPRMF